MNKIIQCPSCNTKFALNASQLAGIENPKFHCSRCNTIFSLEEQSNGEYTSTLETTTVPEPEKPTAAASSDDYFSKKSDSDDNTFEEEQDEESEFESSPDEDIEEDQDIDEQEDDDETADGIENEFNDEPLSIETTPKPEQLTFQERKINDTASNPQWNSGEDSSTGSSWKLGSDDNSSQIKTPEIAELPLTYEPEEEKIEEIAIDWPTDQGTHQIEVDLSQLSKKLTSEAGSVISNSLQNESSNTSAQENIKPTSIQTTSNLSKAEYKRTPSGSYERPETKSLLASLIGEDIEESKRKSLSDAPTSTLRPDSFSITPSEPEVKTFTLGTPSSVEVETPKIQVKEEETEIKVPASLDIIPISSTPISKNEDIEIVKKANFDDSSENKIGENKIGENKNSENRSFKETTVMKRNEVSLQMTEDDINPKYAEMDFSPTSDAFPSSKARIPKISPKISKFTFSEMGPFGTMLLAWSLPIVLLGILASLALSIEQDKEMKEKNLAREILHNLGLDKLPSDLLPPSDLAISKLSGRLLTLNSREKVILTSGNLLNMSSQNFSNVRIESRIFDKNQIAVAKELSVVPSKMGFHLVKEKTFDEIYNLQNSFKPEQSSITQKSITPFTMAINVSDLEPERMPKFYGVRVYSVARK